MKSMTRLFVLVLLAGMVSFGCGGGGGSDPDPGPGPESTYDISGTVSISGGDALAGVTITLSGAGAGTVTTDSNGYYSFSSRANGSYTVTPSITGYTFTPVSQAVTVNSANSTANDFTATANSGSTYSISGTITKSTGGGLSGVTITLSGTSTGTATTDAGGNYTLSGLANGSYTISPSLSGYTFSPANKAVTVNGANVTTNNFTATANSSDPIITSLLNSMVPIPAGSFMMGSTDNEHGWAHYTTPVHQVTLQAFDIGAYEVTQAQYLAVMGTNPSHFQGTTYPNSENNPVEQVTWQDARAFCTALSTLTGRTFTLPSEAQWEYACRAGTTTLYSYGDSDALLGDYAWTSSNSGSRTHTVGTKLPNNWGLYDMMGNVGEWCLDSWHDNYTGAPTDGSAWEPETGSHTVFRGSSWYFNSPWYFRSATHYNRYSAPDDGISQLGFRVLAVR